MSFFAFLRDITGATRSGHVVCWDEKTAAGWVHRKALVDPDNDEIISTIDNYKIQQPLCGVQTGTTFQVRNRTFFCKANGA